MNFKKVIAVSIFSCLVSSPALALVDGQLLLGQRMAKFKVDGDSETINATEVTLAGHLSLIPIFGFGLYLTNHDYSTSDSDDVMAFDELKGNQLGLEATAELPFDMFDLGIYGRAGYTFYGDYSGKASGVTAVTETNTTETVDLDADYKVTGYKLGVGLKWTPIAIVSALLELNYGAETWELDDYKVDGSSVSGVDGDGKQTFTTILIGAEAAI